MISLLTSHRDVSEESDDDYWSSTSSEDEVFRPTPHQQQQQQQLPQQSEPVIRSNLLAKIKKLKRKKLLRSPRKIKNFEEQEVSLLSNLSCPRLILLLALSGHTCIEELNCFLQALPLKFIMTIMSSLYIVNILATLTRIKRAYM